MKLTSAALVVCRGRDHGVVAPGEERVVERPQVQLGPAVVVGLDDADPLAPRHGECRHGGPREERLDTHIVRVKMANRITAGGGDLPIESTNERQDASE